MKPRMTVGRILKLRREWLGLTLRQVSELSGVDHAYIYRLEANMRSDPSLEVVTKLVNALQIPPAHMEVMLFLRGQVGGKTSEEMRQAADQMDAMLEEMSK